jgi:ferric-dicitrate binding protein FerR (iron transport regulator)
MIDENEKIEKLLRTAGPRPKVSDDVKARVRASVHDEWQQEVTRRRRVRLLGGAGLAAAAALAGVLFLNPATPTAPPVTGTVVETAPGSMRSMEWGSGTLRLDSGTRVRLLSERIAVLESGALYFSSDAGPGGIEIRTKFGTVTDIGTQFEVRLHDDNVEVRVREGRVSVRDTVVEAGHALVATAESVERRSMLSSEWEWVERAAPRIVLDGMTLEEVLRRVAREKGLQLRFENPSAATKRLRGRTALSPDEALRAATAAAGVRYAIDNGVLVVR